MATVGSGDVLAGLIGSLWAQGMERDAAAYSGVFLHGLAGDLARDDAGERSLVAHDLIDYLPDAFNYLEVGEKH
jgi:NAD(P)H-hydrate epimerase